MKYKAAMVAWDPGADRIEVGPWPDTNGWSRPYRQTVGGCLTHVQAMNEAELAASYSSTSVTAWSATASRPSKRIAPSSPSRNAA